MKYRAINIKTGEEFVFIVASSIEAFENAGSNLHLFQLNFSDREWRLELVEEEEEENEN